VATLRKSVAALGPERCDRVPAEARGLENASTLDERYENLLMSSQVPVLAMMPLALPPG